MKEVDFSRDDRWLLPEAVDEVLPPDAAALEGLRRRILDTCKSWGYELVMPPLIEFVDSLLVGMADDLDLQTFRVTDQLSGRMMGVRADMTPQAARIDAHQLRRDAVTRLCYLGTVLNTRPEGPGHSRNPVQLGAEIYGHDGVESDVEIIALMLETLALVGLQDPILDLGHVGILHGLAQEAKLDPAQETQLFDSLQRKATGELRELLQDISDAEARQRLAALVNLNGDIQVLDEAAEHFAGAGEPVLAALARLRDLAAALRRQVPDVRLHFDLAELSGYRFHNGVVFAAFMPGHGKALARGGRYDGIGAVFGRSRPATGFSADLKALVRASRGVGAAPVRGILAPWSDDADLLTRVRQLRQAGERVVMAMPGRNDSPRSLGCDRHLLARDGRWQVEAID
ncbi:ATP phosphoribosyltransferase regulatory subunit [Methylonatrum kenyense]|uniref:ATP phosphoribosyltransferase regulatory subunit n=1 Tax=Methylonatrum kenyense TaxID=455253 RepID=UPI0020C1878E|nr:ATP phosphoribosyltransferase regulatory subunit [Methylonatrum kenyense]MCK8516126.1 ATP phosphoribosyltransferase regulatory subunit [Methylonatrum kenyense]